MGKRTLPDILTDAEEIQLLATFNQRYPTATRNRAMIHLALETGMRQGDLINLQWSDIDPATGRIHIKKGKNDVDRMVFISAAIIDELMNVAMMLKRERTGLIFTTLQGKPVQASYLRRMIVIKARKAGIEKRVYFHLLRHTYLTNLYKRTKDIRMVQEAAGHASILSTQIYTHISAEELRAAMLGEDE